MMLLGRIGWWLQRSASMAQKPVIVRCRICSSYFWNILSAPIPLRIASYQASVASLPAAVTTMMLLATAIFAAALTIWLDGPPSERLIIAGCALFFASLIVQAMPWRARCLRDWWAAFKYMHCQEPIYLLTTSTLSRGPTNLALSPILLCTFLRLFM